MRRTDLKIDKLRVLLVEDNPRDIQLIKDLASEVTTPQLELEYAGLSSEGLKRLARGGIDAVLLDLSLPDSPWFETFEKFRGLSTQVPILVLTGLNDPSLPFETLSGGAQDFLAKGEISGRNLVRSILHAMARQRSRNDSGGGRAGSSRRSEAGEEESGGDSDRSEVCGFRIDLMKRRAWYNGRLLNRMPNMEFLILACLLRHYPEVVTRKTFLKEIWVGQKVLALHTIQAHVYNLRKFLPPGARRLILCIPKQGYRIGESPP